MAYFLKKSNNRKGTYLQIYESHYDSERKQTVHSSVKAIGYVHELIEKGISDPVTFYKDEVTKMNDERKANKSLKAIQKISDVSPLKNVGYFLPKAVLNSLNVKEIFKILQITQDFRFNMYDALCALVFSRFVNPCSKRRTFETIIPTLYENPDISYDQLLSFCEYLGYNYEKIVEMFTVACNDKYGNNTEETYFDCTNFYFEIDREDDFRRKGPSKENRKDPIVGLGLLLDANQIPIGMKMYPGNESEKPVLREIVASLKRKGNITGKTIHVADKGLNCSENIVNAILNHDGYIFSKSVKQLPQTEIDWIFNPNIEWTGVFDDNGNLKYKYIECIDDYPYDIKLPDGSKKKVNLKEKRIVTFNPSLAEKQQYEIKKLVEKAKGLTYARAKKSECGESGKYMVFKSTNNGVTTDEKVSVELNVDAIMNDLSLAGYNMIVTSELKMPAKRVYSTYHNLWRIEESFKIMKSDLDARPVYLQNEDRIKGHFMICYIAVLLERLLQFKTLNNEFGSTEIIEFIRDFQITKATETRYINNARKSKLIQHLEKELKIPLTNLYLNNTQIQKMLNIKL